MSNRKIIFNFILIDRDILNENFVKNQFYLTQAKHFCLEFSLRNHSDLDLSLFVERIDLEDRNDSVSFGVEDR